MKYIGPLLAGGITLIIVLLVGIFSFLPSNNSDPAAVGPMPTEPLPMMTPVSIDTTRLEADFAQRQAIYQNQISELDQALLERQGTYQAQIEQLTAELAARQSKLNDLSGQEQDLLMQVSELETARAERLPVYQTQLQEAKEQYAARYLEMQSQLGQIQSQLAQVNAQLGQ